MRVFLPPGFLPPVVTICHPLPLRPELNVSPLVSSVLFQVSVSFRETEGVEWAKNRDWRASRGNTAPAVLLRALFTFRGCWILLGPHLVLCGKIK